MRRSPRFALFAAVVVVLTVLSPVQEAIAASPVQNKRFLYVSGLVSKDVSIFEVRRNGGLTEPPRLVPTGGGTRGMVLSPDGRTAYVAVGFHPNDQVDTNRIKTYRVGSRGGLTQVGRPVMANGDPVSVVITPNGRNLYVTNRASDTVSAFSVGRGGRLKEIGKAVPSGWREPLGLVATPDGRFLYVSHRGDPDADDIDRVTRFAIGRGGRLTPLGRPATIGRTGGAMAVSPDGRFLYVPCSDSGDVFAFRIGANGDLRPVPGSPFRAADIPISAAATPDGRHLYVADGGLLGSGSRKVTGYRIAGNGALSRIADFTAGESPVALAVAPSGRHLYVSNIDSDEVSAFRIGGTGRLAPVPGSPFPLGPGRQQPALEALAITPNQGPSASFTVRPGSPVRFDASRSRDPDGHIARYDWDFGDGTVLKNGGPRPAHAFPHRGTFKVTLVVTDDEGCSTRVIYTGTSTSCNGSPAARTTHAIKVR